MARRRTHECRNCGAPLGIPEDHERFFVCGSCGSVLEDVTPPEAPPQSPIQITVATAAVERSELRSYSAPRRAGGRLLGAVAAVAVAAGGVAYASGAMDGLAEMAETAVARDRVHNHATATTIGSDDSTGADVVAVARTTDGIELQYLDLDATSPQRWAVAADLPEGQEVFTQLAATPELVIVSSGSTLRAHDRARGAVAWSATLSDVIEPNICTACFRLVGDRVVTLTADGVLAAHAVGSGEQVWAATLQETPRQIVLLGGNPAVLDTVAEVTSLHVFAALDGAPLAQLPLSCADETFGGRNPVGINEHLLEGPDGSIVFVGTPTFGGCAQRWDPGSTSAPAWEVAYQYPSPSGIDATHARVTPAGILIASGTVVELLDLGTGAPRRITELPDSDLLPLGVGGEGVAVVAAQSTRGSATWSLQGIDLGTGGTRWTFALEATDSLLEPGPRFAVDDAWTATLDGADLVVAQYRPDDVALVTQTIPVASGTASQPSTIDLSGEGITDLLSAFDWAGRDLHLSMDGTYLVVDAAGGVLRAAVD